MTRAIFYWLFRAIGRAVFVTGERGHRSKHLLDCTDTEYPQMQAFFAVDAIEAA